MNIVEFLSDTSGQNGFIATRQGCPAVVVCYITVFIKEKSLENGPLFKPAILKPGQVGLSLIVNFECRRGHKTNSYPDDDQHNEQLQQGETLV